MVTEQVNVRFPAGLKDRIKKVAEVDRISFTDWLLDAVAEKLDRGSQVDRLTLIEAELAELREGVKLKDCE